MKDTTKVALGAAVAGGYVLGRAKKGRLAFAVATYLTGRRLGLDPQELVAGGLQKLKDAPQFAELGDQVRGELMEAGRQALTASADRSLAGLADSLHERTRRLEGRGKRDEEEQGEDEGRDEEQQRDEDEEQQRDEDEERDEEKGEGEDQDRDEGDEPRQRRGGAPAGKSARPSKNRAGDRALVGKGPVKKTSAKKAPGKKAAQAKAPAKKAAGGKGSAAKSPPSSSDSRQR
ncbi:histone protein [Streptomyces sp. NPDC006274]|uniref:histone protein n=1 Tax=unclassified Streptomyces TaxID=2593676 RepID=UPI0033A9657E